VDRRGGGRKGVPQGEGGKNTLTFLNLKSSNKEGVTSPYTSRQEYLSPGEREGIAREGENQAGG